MKRRRLFTSTIMLVALFGFTICGSAHAGPAEAKRFMARGAAAMEIAKSPADYQKAVNEFSQAVKEKPEWADAWYNLGVAQESAGDYQGAIDSFKTYLKKSPGADDADAVQTRIYKLEFKLENATEQRKVKSLSADELAGYWKSDHFPSSRVTVESSGNTVMFSSVYGAGGSPAASFTLVDFELQNGAFTYPNGAIGCPLRMFRVPVVGTVSSDKNTMTLQFEKPRMKNRSCSVEYEKITEVLTRM